MTVRAALGLAAPALAAALCLAAASAGAQTAGGSGVIRTEPGSAPAESVVRTAPAAQASLLTYASLGLASLAAVLGAAALTVALAGRGRLDALAEEAGRRAAPDPRPDRLSRLEAEVRALASAPARRPAAEHGEPASAARPSAALPSAAPPAASPAAAARASPFPPPAPGAPAHPEPSPSRGPAPPSTAEELHAWMDGLTARFARLALDPSSAAAGFIAEHAPRGALAGPEGVALLDGFEGAKLWAVRAPAEGEVWALTPGEQAVLNWSAHFAGQRTQVAAEVFGEAFDLVDGGAGLRLEAPALARRDASGRLSVRRRGRLSGFRG